MKKNLYPELMSERELTEGFRELETQMQWEVITWFRDPKKRVAILEQLMESPHHQYRCAILLMLTRNADTISPEGRLFLLPHLMELLLDENGAVRAGALECAGRMIALECEKDFGVWQECLRKILFVSSGREESRAGKYTTGTLKRLLEIVYENVPESAKKSVLSTYSNYFKSTKWGQKSCVCLLRGVYAMPYTLWGAMQRGNILGFVRHFLKNDKGEVRMASLLLLDYWLKEGWKPSPDFAHYLKGVLKDIIKSKYCAGTDTSDPERPVGNKGASALIWIAQQVLGGLCASDAKEGAKGEVPTAVSDGVLYRENLDSAVPGLVKHINLRMLEDRYIGKETSAGLAGYASHLLVFMRLNTEQILFSQAGSDLLQIMGQLEDHQKQEIMTELFKCVELEEDSSHYLPYLVGECWQLIPASMRHELVPELQRLCSSDRVQTVEIVMGIACEILGHLDAEGAAGSGYAQEAEEFGLLAFDGREDDLRPADSGEWEDETEQNSMWIRRSMSGMLCQGIYSDRKIVAENTVFTVGYDLFRKLDGSTATSSDIREPVVSVARSVLIYMREAREPDPLYRFPTVHEAARYLTEIGDSYADPKRPVAFFSGSFDPFSNGHRAVAREVAEMGYQVYVNVDDFAWNRNTQPLDIRRKITMLSIADLAHVRIFPREVVINPDNPGDLRRLEALFPEQKVYLVCGSDRIERDEAYQKEPSEGSVHSFPHIVFTRNEDFGFEYDATENLTGEVISLMLPAYYEHMTSLQIRRNILEDKSIDELVAIPARQYIRRYKLYTDDRIYKREPKVVSIETRVLKEDGVLRVLLSKECAGAADPVIVLGELAARSCAPAGENAERPFRDLEILSVQIDRDAVRGEMHDHERNEPAGDWTIEEEKCAELTGLLMDEALIAFQAEGFEVIYAKEEYGTDDFREFLKERGFVRIPGSQKQYCTDIRTPLVLFGDAAASVLDPFCDDPALIAVQRENIRRMRCGVAGLYPGKTVLFIGSGILNYKLTKRIREQSGLYGAVAAAPFDGDASAWDTDTDLFAQDHEDWEADPDTAHLSSWICVPFGKILKTCRIPGLTTMAFNLEKVYMQDLSGFSIQESAGYPKLSVQIRNLRSMGKPFVLVDDFYHDGFRMQEIARSLRAEGIREERLVVGVVSGKGRENAEKHGLMVDAVYEIPNMKAGILESDLIPFYGGDRVMQALKTQVRPSIYPILPYQMPPALRDAPYQAVYDLSMICLENAKRLFEVLETLYENRHFRRLTLERLGEVIDDPGCPETVADSADALLMPVSVLLTREIMRLKRFYVRRA